MIATNDKPKSKRRWFQFSLRQLFLFVAVVAVSSAYVGRLASPVYQRRLALEHVYPMRGASLPVPWLWRLMGNESYSQFLVTTETSLDDFVRLRALHPESNIDYICGDPIKWTDRYQEIVSADAVNGP